MTPTKSDRIAQCVAGAGIAGAAASFVLERTGYLSLDTASWLCGAGAAVWVFSVAYLLRRR